MRKRSSPSGANKKQPVNQRVARIRFEDKIVPVGRTVMVRNGLINKNAKEPDKRRTHVVIETNQRDLALVRLTTKKPNTTMLPYYQDGNSYFKHFVEVEDVSGKPLRVGPDISQNHKNMDVSFRGVEYIKSTISRSKQKKQFDTKMKTFRNRYKK